MQPSGNESSFCVAGWEVDPASNRMLRDGREVRLEPRAMAVLVYLAEHPGQVVSRAELEAAVWSGMVVSYDAVTGAIQKLRRAFDDNPTRPQVIETISKKGYRLVAAVDPPEPQDSAPSERLSEPAARPSRPSPSPWWASLMLVLVAGLLTGGYVLYRGIAPLPDPAAASKSVAVLPFANLTDDPAQAYLGEGISDDLISALARFSDLRVTARESSSLYADHALTLAELADRLNARYLLRGSVRRAGGRLRINAHLVDADSDSTLWSDTFEGAHSDIFALQDRIIRRIVGALVGRINVTDRQELGRPTTSNIQAYDHFLFGRQRFFRFASAQENQQAREFFRRAIVLDPQFALAHAMLSWTHVFDAMNGWQQPREDSLRLALRVAQHAIDIDPAMPVAYFVRGLAYRELGDWTHALVEAEKAIDYDPNYAGAHVLLGTLLYFDGRAQESLARIQQAIALNPHHPYNYSFHLGQAYYILGRYDEAIEAFSEVLASNPGAERAHLWMAAALAQAGRREDAEWEVEQLLTSNPAFTLARLRHSYPFRRDADLQHLVDGLRKAGL